MVDYIHWQLFPFVRFQLDKFFVISDFCIFLKSGIRCGAYACSILTNLSLLAFCKHSYFVLAPFLCFCFLANAEQAFL